jgi:hypothetical protein
MTRQESFKRRVRARMERTGERYGAARRVLVEQASRPTRPRVSEPETSEEALREATGRGWDEWCDLVDAWPGHADGHGAVATWLQEVHDVPGWWAQTVTVGWERITGRRLPHQSPDGTFTANRSRTVVVDADVLRTTLLDASGRDDLFLGVPTELRSRPTSKNVRLAVGPGSAEIAIDPRDDGRVTVTVAHTRLPDPDDVGRWKAWWGDWLEAIDDSST